MTAGIYIERKRLSRSPDHAKSACFGKARFRTEKDAIREAKRLRRKKSDIGPLSVYRCEFCNQHHVGKATKTILARLRVVSGEPK